MRTILVILALSLPDSAGAQGTADRPEAPGVAIGVIAAPACAFEGIWLMPGVRASVPLGPRLAFDLDVGRVFGRSDAYARSDGVVAGQIRFIRRPAAATNGTQYWFVGLRYFDWRTIDERRTLDSAFTMGVGGTFTMRPGALIVSELGFSGGDGYMFYMNLGVQWEPWRSRRTP